MNNYQRFYNWVKEVDQIVAFTGAGMSTASGIPDFRSPGGFYDQVEQAGYNREEVLSIGFLQKSPKEAYHFYNLTFHKEAKPNKGHLFLAFLENELGKDVSIVTQNIDGLHRRAGSTKIFELHGNMSWRKLDDQATSQDLIEYDELIWRDGIPYDIEGNQRRPNAVLFGESLNSNTIKGAISAIASADLLMVLGTSLQVYPAASFINYFQGKYRLQIDKSIEYPKSSKREMSLANDIVDFFKKIWELF